jgi:hypothetical protein
MRLVCRLLLLGIALALLSAGGAWAAGLSVPGSRVGSGAGSVEAPPFQVSQVSWTLLAANPLLVDSVTVTFQKTGGGPPKWDAYVVLKDASGSVLAVRQTHSISISGNSGTQPIQFPIWPNSAVQARDVALIGVTICRHVSQPHDFQCR